MMVVIMVMNGRMKRMKRMKEEKKEDKNIINEKVKKDRMKDRKMYMIKKA